MSYEIKNRVLALGRKSRLSEMDHTLRSEKINWMECRHPSGDTLLHIAAQSGNVSLMRHLLEHLNSEPKWVDVTNLAGKTPLHEACQNSQPEAVSFLISKGANVRAIKQADWTPLMLACTKTGKNSLSCCRLLLEKGGPVLVADKNKDGWNALHIAAREGDTSIVKELLQFDPSSMQATEKSKNGRTPLHTAALHGCHHVVEELLALNSIDCNVQDSCGATPLHDAVRSGDLKTLTALARSGADLNAYNNEGYGILHMAAQTGQVAMLKYLLEEVCLNIKIDLNMKTTPLHCAVRAGQTEAVVELLEKGADPKSLDFWGRSCYDIIPEKNVSDIKSMLDKAVTRIDFEEA
ncbi:ankyrin repeat domain-containing protein 16-like [Frankliniella occidentalis]|uniref:Ankyrin repeat domain-containing protein 16-like n=1 Tax=Frankliniella occidentalis TaxID=133901 RepID=A0A6J1SFC7_FRAOC|nr:ankyrin repeat domain-containing protein 16-like [Frankliniella occidentalis]